MINCVVIEDDPVQANMMCGFIKQTTGIQIVAKFESAINALKNLASIEHDIIFLDVQMPGMNGIEFIQASNFTSKVVLFSGSKKYALDGYDCNAVDYLLKPVSYDRFLLSLEKTGLINGENNHLLIKHKGEYIKVNFSDIIRISSASEYVIIYTDKGKYMLYSSMANLLEKLPNHFIRIHRSTIVNYNKVTAFSSKQIEMDGVSLNISRSYWKELKLKLRS